MDDPLLIPARILNEWTYCPRLAWLAWVEGEWADNRHTVEGRRVHRRVDAKADPFPTPDALDALDDGATVEARSVLLSAPDDHLIARLDLVERLPDGTVRPVDHKKGRVPADGPWQPERVQIGAQALALRAQGYRVTEGILYFAGSRRRISLPIDDALIAQVRHTVDELRAALDAGQRPEPLVDSPKCVGCSLAPICLPDETVQLTGRARPKPADPHGDDPFARDTGPRALHPPQADGVPVHITEPTAHVRKQGEELLIELDGEIAARAPLPQTGSLSLYGPARVSPAALRACLERGIPVSYHNRNGWLFGLTQGLASHGIETRRAQHRAADDPARTLQAARFIVRGKIRNQRVILRRNHPDLPANVRKRLGHLAAQALRADTLDQLRGYEGEAARIYFEHFGALLRPPGDTPGAFDFRLRKRRPPPDPVNALLGYTYALLAREWTLACQQAGLDPMLGYLHTVRAARPALALDLMEPDRPVLADSVVVRLINTGRAQPHHFVTAGGACALTPAGKRALLAEWTDRLDTRITHPVFGYKITWRQAFVVQARLFARWLTGELPEYPPLEVR